MLKTLHRIPASNVAYVLLLLAFVSLGLLVAALALGSGLALIAGGALIVCLSGSVAGFRTSGRRLAEASQPGDSGQNASMFSTPLRRDEVDQYLRNYRAARTDHATGDLPMAVGHGEESPDPTMSPDPTVSSTRHGYAA